MARKSPVKLAFGLIALWAVMSGCFGVLAIRDFSDLTRSNNAKIMTLRLGMTTNEVNERIGPSQNPSVPNPFKSELYSSGEDVFTALFFYTGTGYVSAIPDSDLTPVVFKNDSLEGWGWMHWKSVASNYNFNIRRR